MTNGEPNLPPCPFAKGKDYNEGFIAGMREGFSIAKHADAKIVGDRAKITWDYARRELNAAIRLRGGK